MGARDILTHPVSSSNSTQWASLLDQLRGLALDCAPWHEDSLMISFLTDRDQFDEMNEGKWATPSWRFFNFTSGPSQRQPGV